MNVNTKSIIIITGALVLVLLAVVFAFTFHRGADTLPPTPELTQVPEVCSAVPTEQRTVEISWEKVFGQSSDHTLVYRASVETQFPVNVVGLGIANIDQSLRFLSADYSVSAFSIQAPTDLFEGGMKFNRGIAGARGGLLGKGEFGVFVFERNGVSKQEPVLDVSKTDAVFNNGCAQRGNVVSKR